MCITLTLTSKKTWAKVKGSVTPRNVSCNKELVKNMHVKKKFKTIGKEDWIPLCEHNIINLWGSK
jgi:hypothetical protein